MVTIKKLYDIVDLGEDIAMSQLSIKDQLIQILAGKEEETEDLKQASILTRKANLRSFLQKATENKSSVKMKLHSNFAEILEDVLEELYYYEYFNVDIIMPKLKYDTDYYFELRLVAK